MQQMSITFLLILGDVRPNGQTVMQHCSVKRIGLVTATAQLGQSKELFILRNLHPNGQVALQHQQRKK